MNKVGFVVGHPTQFEGPFFKYVAQLAIQDGISVYYFNYKGGQILDKDMKESSGRDWGIDLLSDYKWCNISDSQFASAKKVLKENKYIMVSGYTSFISVMIIFLSRFYDKKVGLRLDSVPWNNQSGIKRILKSTLLQSLSLFIDTFWVTGSQSAKFVRACGINADRIKTFSYITDNEWFQRQSSMTAAEQTGIRNAYGIDPDTKVILSIVKLVQRESPQELIQAFINADIKGYSLVVVGDGELKPSLEQMASNVSKDNEIVFTGYISYAELPKIYGICTVYVHPSENEPWGVSVQEALACGLPVITTDRVGAGYDLIKENKNGWMYPHGQVKALTRLLEEKVNHLPHNISEVNQEILSFWNYRSTWERLENHIDAIGENKTV